ncbi:hypothetical protein ES703_41134 [subsurface metagenome]
MIMLDAPYQIKGSVESPACGVNSGKNPRKVPNWIKTGINKATTRSIMSINSFFLETPNLSFIFSLALTETSSKPILR